MDSDAFRNAMYYTLYENESVSFQALNITSSDRLLDSIEALNTKHGSRLVEVKRHELKATQFVGILQTPYGTLNILPKVDRGADSERLALHNLVTMLCYAYDIPLLDFGSAPTQTGRGAWLELMTQWFCQLLYRELQQGIERVYVSVEERSLALKGRWLVEQQLTRSPHIRHAFDIRYDDFSPDTPLNRVFLFVVNVLSTLSRLPQNRRLLSEIDTMLGEVSQPNQITQNDLNSISFTRLNERFKPAFQIARMLIESMTMVLQTGSVPLRAFMFDMNQLFELFVAGFAARHWREIGGKAHRDFQIQAQMKNRTTLYLAQTADGLPVFKLIPDLTLNDRDAKTRLIIDTKYKRLTLDNRRLDASQADVYQMLAYAGRLECPRILLLYPSNKGEMIEGQFSIINSSVTIDIKTINLHQSLADTTALIGDFRRIFSPYFYSA